MTAAQCGRHSSRTPGCPQPPGHTANLICIWHPWRWPDAQIAKLTPGITDRPGPGIRPIETVSCGFRWRGAACNQIIGAPWRAVIKLVCEGAMTVSRLRDIPGIGVDKVGDAADAAADPRFLRLENLDTDLRPPEVALEATRAAIDRDDANSYLPFQGYLALREAA